MEFLVELATTVCSPSMMQYWSYVQEEAVNGDLNKFDVWFESTLWSVNLNPNFLCKTWSQMFCRIELYIQFNWGNLCQTCLSPDYFNSEASVYICMCACEFKCDCVGVSIFFGLRFLKKRILWQYVKNHNLSLNNNFFFFTVCNK